MFAGAARALRSLLLPCEAPLSPGDLPHSRGRTAWIAAARVAGEERGRAGRWGAKAWARAPPGRRDRGRGGGGGEAGARPKNPGARARNGVLATPAARPPRPTGPGTGPALATRRGRERVRGSTSLWHAPLPPPLNPASASPLASVPSPHPVSLPLSLPHLGLDAGVLGRQRQGLLPVLAAGGGWGGGHGVVRTEKELARRRASQEICLSLLTARRVWQRPARGGEG